MYMIFFLFIILKYKFLFFKWIVYIFYKRIVCILVLFIKKKMIFMICRLFIYILIIWDKSVSIDVRIIRLKIIL